MTTKNQAIRKAIEAGEKPKDIAKRLKAAISTVYTVKWKMNKEAKNKISITKSEADLAKKLNIPLEVYARQKLKMEQEEIKKPIPSIEQELYIDDLMEIRRQIDNLRVIESFLQTRIQQMEQNTKWQTRTQ